MKPTTSSPSLSPARRRARHRAARGSPNSVRSTPLGDTMILSASIPRATRSPRSPSQITATASARRTAQRLQRTWSRDIRASLRCPCRCRPPHPPRRRGSRRAAARRAPRRRQRGERVEHRRMGVERRRAGTPRPPLRSRRANAPISRHSPISRQRSAAGRCGRNRARRPSRPAPRSRRGAAR